jgi:preprotein translocase subunit YajC
VKSLGSLLPFIVILLAFWLLIIRPSRNRQRAQQRMQQELSVGQQVMTTSGLYGEVTAIEDEAVVLQTAPGVTMRWSKPAVARILTPEEPERGDDGFQDPVEADEGDLDVTGRDGAATTVDVTGKDSTERRSD